MSNYFLNTIKSRNLHNYKIVCSIYTPYKHIPNNKEAKKKKKDLHVELDGFQQLLAVNKRQIG